MKRVLVWVCAAVLSTALAAAGLPALAADASAQEQVYRLGGANRYVTAIKVSQDTFPAYGAGSDALPAVGGVVLARSDDFADALSGVPLAVTVNGPLLLTPTASLWASTEDEIERVLAPGGTVYVLGSAVAISKAVVDRLTADGYAVKRLEGDDRYQTSVRIAEETDRLAAAWQTVDTRVVAVTTGAKFPDALSAGAAVGRIGTVVLTRGTNLPSVVKAYLDTAADRQKIAIGADGAAAAGSYADARLVGVDRYDTAAKVASAFGGSAPIAGIASGANFPDALAGAVEMAQYQSPILLTRPDDLPGATLNFLTAHRDPISAGVVFGSTAVVSERVRLQAQAAIQ